MNDIITNGTEIKQRIIAELNNASKCIYIAMSYFTDRDIASSIIEAKKRNVVVDIILSSNIQNETVKLMLLGANINVHSFETGDPRGIMHHKFCLLDNNITINGSYNFSYNASNNNVENIHVTNSYEVYSQLYTEFERLKYNIDNHIDVNNKLEMEIETKHPSQSSNIIETFSQQLHNLVYTSAQINTEAYKKQGYDNSKESGGNLDIFRTEYKNIKEEIRVFATSENLGSKKSVLTSNISNLYEIKKLKLISERNSEIEISKRDIELEMRQIRDNILLINLEKTTLESGNQITGERGVLQINSELEKNKLEKTSLEQTIVIRKFWSVGTVLSLIGFCVLVYYLSMFFASALYKVFFERNIIQASLEAGINPGLPQLVDANAILKIFNQQGTLFGIIALLFFLIPILLSNLELIGSKKKWVNVLSFWVGILIFDIVVSTMVALNTDEVKSLLAGRESQLSIFEVVQLGEFWLIFVFGMIPLIITHYLIVSLENAYKMSQRDLVNAEVALKIKMIDEVTIDLNTDKEYFTSQIRAKESLVHSYNEKIHLLEIAINNSDKKIQQNYETLLNQVDNIFEDFHSKIISGKIFTDEIMNSVISAYKSGFIEFLPEFYAEAEVAKRVKEIELI
jgi:hypothetical protein